MKISFRTRLCAAFGCALSLFLTAPTSIQGAEQERVVASSFGFDPADATDCLQRAIDSDARTVVVDKQASAWQTRPLKLRSDLELVLEEGVEIVAKQGEFKSKGECLLTASRVSNITIRGEGKGATLRMRKKEYWEEPYEKSEWRHGVSLLSSSNVTIENLTIAETGGDGIYLGVSAHGIPCKNITIRKVDCVANNRQGISVISVDGLLIEQCLLRDTVGTPPAAGIDFEPNLPDEQITNVVMRDVLAIDNYGDGYAFYLPNMKNWGAELSFTLERCQAVRNNAGLALTVANGEERMLSGKMVLRDCDFIGNHFGVSLRSKWAAGAPFIFDGVRIVTASADAALKYGAYADYEFSVRPEDTLTDWRKTTTDSGVSLIAVGTDWDANGGFEFNDVTIVDATDDENKEPETWFAVRDASSEGVGFQKLSGAIKSELILTKSGQKKTKTQEVNDETIKALFPDLNARRVMPIEFSALTDAKLSQELVAAYQARVAENGATKNTFRIRGGGAYYFFAKEGEDVSWKLSQRRIGNYATEKVDVVVTTPSGAKVDLETKPGDVPVKEYVYKATEEGWFKLETKFGSSSVELTSEKSVILTAARPNLNAIYTTGSFTFYVPEDAEDLGVRIVGSAGERVTATLIDPSGKTVERLENISALGAWTTDFDEASGKAQKPQAGFWTLKLEKPTIGVLEDYAITILGVPALLY